MKDIITKLYEIYHLCGDRRISRIKLAQKIESLISHLEKKEGVYNNENK